MKTGDSLFSVSYIVINRIFHKFTLNPRVPNMFSLPIFVGFDYHQKFIQVCVMNQKRKNLANVTMANDLDAVHRVVAPFGSNVHVTIEASTRIANFADILIHRFQWYTEPAFPG